MRAANELDAKELPQPSMSIVQERFDEAMEELNKVDSRIPTDIGRKAVGDSSQREDTNLIPKNKNFGVTKISLVF